MSERGKTSTDRETEDGAGQTKRNVGGTERRLIIYEPKSVVCYRNVNEQSIKMVDLKRKM